MDKFCEDVSLQMCLDFNNEEVNDISEAVRTMVHRLIKIVNRKRSSEKKFEKLVPCGSMEEKVRIWNVMHGEADEAAQIEFDFLALMKSDGLLFEPSCQRSVHVLNELQGRSLEDCFTSNIDLNNSIFWSVHKTCACQRSVRYENIGVDFVLKQGNGCEKCTVMKPTGCLGIHGETQGGSFSRRCSNYHYQLELEWTSKCTTLSSCKFTREFNAERTPLAKLSIIVDIHPAFEVTERTDQQAQLPWLPGFMQSAVRVSQTHLNRCYVIAILCEKMHDSCWRVSHCEAEMEILKGTSLHHRLAYMTLKFIRDCLFKDNTLISSYHMKSALLRHIKHCKTPESDCSVHGCVQNVIEYLTTCFYSQAIPDIANGVNLLFCSSTFESKHVQRNLSYTFGDIFSLVQFLFSDYLSGGYSFQKALKCLDCLHRLLMYMWQTTIGHRHYKACSDIEKLETELIKIIEDYREVDDKLRVVFDTLFEVKHLEDKGEEHESRVGSLPERRYFLPAKERRKCTVL